MRINNISIALSLLYSIVPVDSVLRCLSGNSHRPIECTSQSYCVTLTTKSGSVQNSCDGNSVNQISLCSMFSIHGIPQSVSTDYSGFPVSLGVPSSQSSGSTKLSSQSYRHMRKAPAKMCFNAGDLGHVCCCNTDFCNSSRSVFLLSPIIILFVFLFHI